MKGCGSAVDITFEPALTQEGAYEFAVLLEEGETIVCTTTIPRQPNETCIGTAGWSHSRFRTSTQPEGDRVEALLLWDAPRSFELVIRKDGEQISRTSHRPKYSQYHPNGVECDGILGGCPTASVHVNL